MDVDVRYNSIYYVEEGSTKLNKFYTGGTKPSMEEAKDIVEQNLAKKVNVNIIKVLIQYGKIRLSLEEFTDKLIKEI